MAADATAFGRDTGALLFLTVVGWGGPWNDLFSGGTAQDTNVASCHPETPRSPAPAPRRGSTGINGRSPPPAGQLALRRLTVLELPGIPQAYVEVME